MRESLQTGSFWGEDVQKKDVWECLELRLRIWSRIIPMNESGVYTEPMGGYTNERYEYACNECSRMCRATIEEHQIMHRFNDMKEG